MSEPGVPILETRAISKRFGGVQALDGVSMKVHAGEVVALSGAQRQAVAIGRALDSDARVMVMDEPTAALGVPEQRKVIALIKALKAQGRGIIFISHKLGDIFAVSDRIVVLRRGVLAGERAI